MDSLLKELDKYDYNSEEEFKDKVKQETKNYKVIFCDWG